MPKFIDKSYVHEFGICDLSANNQPVGPHGTCAFKPVVLDFPKFCFYLFIYIGREYSAIFEEDTELSFGFCPFVGEEYV